MDDPDAPHPGRGDEPGQIGGRSPAEPDDDVRAGQTGLPAHFPAEPGDGQRLALLRVGHLDAVGVDTSGLELPAGGLGGFGEGGLVDDERPRGAEARDGAGQALTDAAADPHRVGPVAADVDADGVGLRSVGHGSTLRDVPESSEYAGPDMRGSTRCQVERDENASSERGRVRIGFRRCQ